MPDRTSLLGAYYCRARTAPVFLNANRQAHMRHQLVRGDRVEVLDVQRDYRYCTYGWVHRGFLRRRDPYRDVDTPWDFAQRCTAFSDTPYLPGGTTPHGADCSGVVWGVFRGAPTPPPPRWVAELVRWGQEVPVADAQPQDLVLFHNRNSHIRHCGVVTPEGQVLHSSMTHGGSRIEPLTTFTNIAQVRRVA